MADAIHRMARCTSLQSGLGHLKCLFQKTDNQRLLLHNRELRLGSPSRELELWGDFLAIGFLSQLQMPSG